MQALAELCVRRPVTATVFILVLAVFGIFGYLQLGVDRFPKVDFPMVLVTTRLPGAAAAEMETEVTDRLEEAINTVSGVEEIRSISAEGFSQIAVTFVLEKNGDVGAQEVRDRISGALPDLPEGTEPPVVEKIDPDAEPVVTLALSGDVPVRELTEYADKTLRRRFESVNGVGQVVVLGGRKRQINVVIDPARLRAQGLSVVDVARALERNNVEVPGGTVKRGETEFTLRTLGRLSDVESFASIPVRRDAGHTVKLGDVAFIEDGEEEAKSSGRLNDTPAVLLNIRKQSGANSVEVVKSVVSRLDEVAKALPPGYRVEKVRDESIFIEAAVHSVQEHLIVGSFLAAFVVLLFLRNGRATLIAALAIPTSIISTFAVMWAMGFTLNVLTLLALTLCVGIVIDDAIVVLENIFRFIEEKGMEPRQAAVEATREIGMAVVAITLSLVAVFLPIAFMAGIVGRFMQSFGITMASAILLSMLVSFTLTPMLCSRWLRADMGKKKAHKSRTDDDSIPTGDVEPESHKGVYHYIEEGYLNLLKFALRFRWATIIGCFLSLIAVPPLFSALGKNFLPRDDQSEFSVYVRASEGTSLEAMEVTLARVARELRRVEGVIYTVASAGDNQQQAANAGSIYVRLSDTKERRYSQYDAMEYVRTAVLAKFNDEGLITSVDQVGGIGNQRDTDLNFVLGGPDMARLDQYSRELMDFLREMPGVVDVDSDFVLGKPEYGAVINREKAASLGVSVDDVAQTLRLLVAGAKVSTFNDRGEQYEVRVRAESASRGSIDNLNLFTVPTADGSTVLLTDVVHFEERSGPSQINRLDRRRSVTILGNLTGRTSQQDVITAIMAKANELNMGPEYGIALQGQGKELGKAFFQFIITFATAFIFMYLVIAAQFESWLHPVTILLALPLTLPFAFLSLLMFGQTLNIFSVLGVLVLFSVVKKNSILQVDHTNQLKRRGLTTYDALLRANRDRLRPILMTTFSFVAGMLPLLLSSGTGSGTNRAISSVIIGGQMLSLLLTLVATPVAYSLFDSMSHSPWWGRLWRAGDAGVAWVKRTAAGLAGMRGA